MGTAQPWEGQEKPRKYWSRQLQGQQFGAVRGDTAPKGVGAKLGTSFQRRRQRVRDKLLSGACLQRQRFVWALPRRAKTTSRTWMCLQAGLSTSRDCLEVGKGGGMTHYRQAHRLTPPGHGFPWDCYVLRKSPGMLCHRPSPSPGILCSWQPPQSPCPQGWSNPPGVPVWSPTGGAAQLCPRAAGKGNTGGECCRKGVLQEGVLPRGRTAACSGKRHNRRKPRFLLPMEKTLQDPWGEQPDTINVRIS